MGSKGHRTTVARLREEERAKEAQLENEEKAYGKRKADADEESSEDGDSKRRKVGSKDVDMDSHEPTESAAQFPDDFFSDPSRGPLPSAMEDSDDETEPTASAAPVTQVTDALDSEWQQFQQAVLNPPDEREKYDRATLFAEPEMASETPQGFPPQQPEAADAEVPAQMDEEQKRRQKEEDERELIMDRLLDEERAQEDADMRVTVMKAKLEALKLKREAAKAAKVAKS